MNLKTFNEIMNIGASTFGKHSNQPFNIQNVKRLGNDDAYSSYNRKIKSLTRSRNKYK